MFERIAIDPATPRLSILQQRQRAPAYLDLRLFLSDVVAGGREATSWRDARGMTARKGGREEPPGRRHRRCHRRSSPPTLCLSPSRGARPILSRLRDGGQQFGRQSRQRDVADAASCGVGGRALTPGQPFEGRTPGRGVDRPRGRPPQDPRP